VDQRQHNRQALSNKEQQVQINTDQLADNLCIAYLAAQLDITIATAAKQYKSLGTTGTYWKAMAQYLYQENEVEPFEVREAQGETLPVTDPLPMFLGTRTCCEFAHKVKIALMRINDLLWIYPAKLACWISA
jgi:hypothetical protein